MEILEDVLDWTQDYAIALGIWGTFIAAFFPLLQFIWAKRDENNNKEFSNYHKLIADLVDSVTPKLDRQIAVIYELRHFKKYYPVSIRILKGFRKTCEESRVITDPSRIIQEIDLSVAFMEKHI